MSKKQETPKKKKDVSEKETKLKSIHIKTKQPKFQFWDEMWNE